MKKILLLLVLFLGVYHLHAQCPTSNVTLNSQTAVDNFVATYATTCTDIPVSITIRGSVTDLNGLNFITSIQGSLTFEAISDLHSITGFSNLTTIGGSLLFTLNTRLTFNGLIGLETIGANLSFSNNITFESLIGLTALERIEGNVSAFCINWDADDVSGINTFSSLSSIGGDLRVFGNTNGSQPCYTGATWQFQTPFNAIANYLPFSATLISPENGETITTTDIVLTWEGNDPDDDETELLEYAVYVDTANLPVQEVANMLTTETHTETLTTGVYYWKIQSKDPRGNISNSEIRHFIIE